MCSLYGAKSSRLRITSKTGSALFNRCNARSLRKSNADRSERHTPAVCSPNGPLRGMNMSITNSDSNTTAPTQLLPGTHETYAYRRLGGGIRRPLICLQHFTGTLDNWDPAVVDALASDREVILFDGAGLGRSTGKV